MSKRADRRLDTKRERAALRAALSGARGRLIYGYRWNHRPLPVPESRDC